MSVCPPPLHARFLQAASLYERAVNIEETAERHVFLGEALVLAERKGEALWHYGRAADLYDDREYKVRKPRCYVDVDAKQGPLVAAGVSASFHPIGTDMMMVSSWVCTTLKIPQPCISPLAMHRFQRL